MIYRFALLLIPVFSFAQSYDDPVSSIRLENEFKLSVPEHKETALWEFLQKEFSGNGLSGFDETLKANIESELFTDLYFDSESLELYQKEAGVRYRRRYIRDSLTKSIIQLKLPLNDETGIIRQEIKFNPYEKKKRNDRKAEHPFWQYVHPRDRDDVNLHLAAFELKGDILVPSLKINQLRKRIYLTENDIPVLTITLDDVAYGYFPYMGFTELELELNEIRYSNADQEEKAIMEALNTKIKDRIMSAFPELEQDQTPKYNKMKNLATRSFLAKAYDNLMFIILGILVLMTGAMGYFYYRKQRLFSRF